MMRLTRSFRIWEVEQSNTAIAEGIDNTADRYAVARATALCCMVPQLCVVWCYSRYGTRYAEPSIEPAGIEVRCLTSTRISKDRQQAITWMVVRRIFSCTAWPRQHWQLLYGKWAYQLSRLLHTRKRVLSTSVMTP